MKQGVNAVKTISRNGGRAAVVSAVLMGLAACATGAKPEAMIVAPTQTDKPFAQALQHAMCVRTVTGGEKTNPLWASKVDNQGFQAALTSSLNGAGLGTSPGCSFPVDVNLLGLSQPFAGFNMTVTSHVNYKVYDQSGQPVVLATVDAPYTAKVSDAFVGVERLRLANEGSIRTNISQFFDKLRAVEIKSAAAAPATPTSGN
jgi:hypothetical protein